MHVLYDEHNLHFHLHALCGERSSERQPLSALGCKQYIPLELEAVVTKNPILPRRDTYTFGGSRQRRGEVDVRESDPIQSGSAVRRQLFIRIRQCRPFPCAAASANPPVLLLDRYTRNVLAGKSWCLYRAIWICHGSDSQLRTEIPSPKTRAPSAESVDMRMTIRTGRVCDGDNERRSHSEFAVSTTAINLSVSSAIMRHGVRQERRNNSLETLPSEPSHLSIHPRSSVSVRMRSEVTFS
ncbi:hypothetical protein BC826DRAFT_588611 [Russula brevipes]|nr:hypothetical protein BC826DRAFT_588611 [Russula brevipes]